MAPAAISCRWRCAGPAIPSIDRGPGSILAAVRRGPREGTLLDAAGEPNFVPALLAKIHAGETAGSGAQKIEFRPTEAFARDRAAGDQDRSS